MFVPDDAHIEFSAPLISCGKDNYVPAAFQNPCVNLFSEISQIFWLTFVNNFLQRLMEIFFFLKILKRCSKLSEFSEFFEEKNRFTRKITWEIRRLTNYIMLLLNARKRDAENSAVASNPGQVHVRRRMKLTGESELPSLETRWFPRAFALRRFDNRGRPG